MVAVAAEVVAPAAEEEQGKAREGARAVAAEEATVVAAEEAAAVVRVKVAVRAKEVGMVEVEMAGRKKCRPLLSTRIDGRDSKHGFTGEGRKRRRCRVIEIVHARDLF